jgi:hypothetical protein
VFKRKTMPSCSRLIEIAGLAIPLLSACGAPTSEPDQPSVLPGVTTAAPTATQPPSSTPPTSGTSNVPPQSTELSPVDDGSDGGFAVSPAQCDPNATGATFEASCVACAGDDLCAQCLCTDCTDMVEQCTHTTGCTEILACVRDTGCSGTECYCGDANITSCATGAANGVCKSVMLDAPGAHAPTLGEPSAGPATDAALAVARCSQRSDRCTAVCPESE